jgi:hypothetical protein
MTIPTHRAFTAALIGIVVAGILLRPQIALAVIGRGDDALRAGDLRAAVRYYNRALSFDPDSEVAIDRLAIAGILSHDVGTEKVASQRVALALRRRYNEMLTLDEALLNLKLHNLWGAREAFLRVASHHRDPRALVFANAVTRRLRRIARLTPRFEP